MALVLTAALLLANAFFVGAEFALVSARRSRMEELAAGGSRRARRAIAGMQDISVILAGAQLGIAVASLGLGALSEPALERGFSTLLHIIGLPQGVSHILAFAGALLIVAGAHVVLGEMVPKNLAIAGPERAALWLGPPMVLFTRVTRPILWLFNEIANGALRLLGMQPTDEISHTYTAEDLASMTRRAHDEGMLDAVENRLTQGALELEHRTVAEVMTPWRRVVRAPDDITAAGLERLVAKTGFTRYPVDAPEVHAYLHAKAALRVHEEVRDQPLPGSLRHPLPQIAPETPLSELLASMRRSRSHLALVGERDDPVGVASFDDVLALIHPSESATPR